MLSQSNNEIGYQIIFKKHLGKILIYDRGLRPHIKNK